jgi:hypothetical protein
MQDPIYFDKDYREAVTYLEKEFALDLLKAVPDLEAHLEKRFVEFEFWNEASGMVFMQELLRCCDRLVEHNDGKEMLPRIFSFLEDKAAKLDSSSKESYNYAAVLPPELRAIDSLFFTFTDNPTGKDPTLWKLAPFMGPRIHKMSTLL